MAKHAKTNSKGRDAQAARQQAAPATMFKPEKEEVEGESSAEAQPKAAFTPSGTSTPVVSTAAAAMLSPSMLNQRTSDGVAYSDLKPAKRKGALVGGIIGGVVAAALAAVFAYFIVVHPFGVQADFDPAAKSEPAVLDVRKTPQPEPEAEPEPEEPAVTPTPVIASYDDVLIHAPIQPEAITTVLFHQASYDWALAMETQLPDADIDAAYETHSTRQTGQVLDSGWLDADAVHMWRTGAAGAMNSSIDCGGAVGTPVYAPVSGTVILLTDYMLYDTVPDVEVHIQPDGHPELDVVVLHTSDQKVAVGDHVEAGVTQISQVRDIASQLTGIQLADFTAPEDPGNHAHVQINDATRQDYRERKLAGALVVE